MMEKNHFSIPLLQTVSTILLVVLVVGCAHRAPRPDGPLNDSDTPASFSRTGSDTAPEEWWTEFDDPILTWLVKRSLNNNFSLKQSWERLREARAATRSRRSELGPAIDVSAAGRRQKTRESGSTSYSKNSGLDLAADYEVDLWGRIESSVEASEFDQRATRSDLQAAAISLTAEVARTWFQLAEQYGQKKILGDQLETNRQILQLVEKRFELGQVRAADVLRQRRLLEATREQQSDIRTRIRVLENQLAILLGRPPSQRVNPVRTSLPELPPLPETGVPAEVLQRRPDVRSNYFQIQSADRRLAEAVLNRYPRLTISASLATDADEGVALFEDWVQQLAGDLALPLLDSGQRRAEVLRQRSVMTRRFYQYYESLLTGYREIEDALIRETEQRQQITSIEKQLHNARQTTERLRSQYTRGSIPYLDVLDALESEQQLERDLLSGRRELLEFRVALYRSTAGGILDLSEPSPNEILKEVSIWKTKN